MLRTRLHGALLLASFIAIPAAYAQKADLDFLNHNQPILDAHNCYPGDHVQRALNSGFPVSIEQDLAWYVDPATQKGRVVVTHTSKPLGTEPTLREYFFDQVRPIVEKALAEHKTEQWPLIILHYRGTRENAAQAGTYEELFTVTTEHKAGDWVVTKYDAMY